MENMKITWENLTTEQKTNYLNFWFHYYGGVIYTLEELEQFMELAKTKADEIYNHICTLFIMRDTIQSSTLVMAMRQNKVDDLLAHNMNQGVIESLDIKPEDKKEMLAIYEETGEMIINEIAKSYSKRESSGFDLILINKN